MADRADFLARTLLTRIRALEAADNDVPGQAQSAARWEQVVTKILAVELGVVDAVAIQATVGALPRLKPDEPVPDRDVRELADFFRKKFGAML